MAKCIDASICWIDMSFYHIVKQASSGTKMEATPIPKIRLCVTAFLDTLKTQLCRDVEMIAVRYACQQEVGGKGGDQMGSKQARDIDMKNNG